MNRYCQRQTQVLEVPVWRMISWVPDVVGIEKHDGRAPDIMRWTPPADGSDVPAWKEERPPKRETSNGRYHHRLDIAKMHVSTPRRRSPGPPVLRAEVCPDARCSSFFANYRPALWGSRPVAVPIFGHAS